MNFSAINAIPDGQHRKTATVIGAERTILVNASPEFGHDDHRHTISSLVQIGIECREAARQQINLGSLKAICRPLKEMSVPATKINAGGFESDVGFDESGNFTQPAAKFIIGINGITFRL